MAITEIEKKTKAINHTKRIPHLKVVNGKIEIDSNDAKQVKWFKEFKK